jgi:hypothetical protein
METDYAAQHLHWPRISANVYPRAISWSGNLQFISSEQDRQCKMFDIGHPTTEDEAYTHGSFYFELHDFTGRSQWDSQAYLVVCCWSSALCISLRKVLNMRTNVMAEAGC